MKTLSDCRAGDTFTHVRTCDRLRPIYYAAASGDFNPIHVDAEFARAAGLPGPILQGMCTYGWLAEACTAYFGDPGSFRRLTARFSRPVLPGDTVTFEGVCTHADGERVRVEVAARNQRGEDVLRSASAEAASGDAPSPVFAAGAAAPGLAQEAAGTPSADPRMGRRFGPYRYEAGLEKMRDFALAVAGGIPTRMYGHTPDPAPHPLLVDEDAGRASRHGSVIGAPTFGAVFAMQPFAAALVDPVLALDLPRVVHGEQELVYGAPVRPGDRLETRGEVIAIEKRGKLDIVVVRSSTSNQHGAAVLEGLWTAAVR
jgi:acyl dehydratase